MLETRIFDLIVQLKCILLELKLLVSAQQNSLRFLSASTPKDHPTPKKTIPTQIQPEL